ncbi:MAG: LytR C-terminal domain-containing protein [Patescibacteria group bacterium]|nr:LytR C-terminal domain-containing protein [Patescibacteria group bacterium]
MSRSRSRKKIWVTSRIKKQLRVVGMALVVVFGAGVVYSFSYLYHVFKHPFVRAGDNIEVDFSWSSNSPANFAWFVAKDSSHNSLEKAAVLHVNPQLSRVVVINLPSRRFSLSRGVAFSLTEISRELNIPIQGYFLVEKAALEKLANSSGDCNDWSSFDWTTVFRMPHYLRSFKGYFWSNLSLPEFMKLAKVFLSTREDQRYEIFPSGEDLSPDSLDDLCSDNRIKSERFKVLILNGTKVSGLAGDAASWAENLGCFVLDVANAPRQNYENSVILARNSSSYTVRRLSNAFGIDDIRELSGDINWARRADIVVILGLDKESFF